MPYAEDVLCSKTSSFLRHVWNMSVLICYIMVMRIFQYWCNSTFVNDKELHLVCYQLFWMQSCFYIMQHACFIKWEHRVNIRTILSILPSVYLFVCLAQGLFALAVYNSLRAMSSNEKRVDPSDGKPYTFSVLADWYRNLGWRMLLIEEYWAAQNVSIWRPHQDKVEESPSRQPPIP